VDAALASETLQEIDPETGHQSRERQVDMRGRTHPPNLLLVEAASVH
jgi:hypothetical protein